MSQVIRIECPQGHGTWSPACPFCEIATLRKENHNIVTLLCRARSVIVLNAPSWINSELDKEIRDVLAKVSGSK